MEMIKQIIENADAYAEEMKRHEGFANSRSVYAGKESDRKYGENRSIHRYRLKTERRKAKKQTVHS